MTALFLTVALFAADPTITTVVGTGERGYSGDGGPATKATLDNPFDVVFDRHGNMYLSDTNNHVVRKVAAMTGIITTLAGTGKKGYTGDGGPATKATLNEPYGIAVAYEGHLCIVDRLNYCLRIVDPETGVITTIAGTGKSGFGGDGGPAAQAMLREPNDVCLFQDRLVISDVKDQRIRLLEFEKTFRISTFAGTGEKNSAGDSGPVDKASFAGPRATAASSNHRALYVVEREGNCVRKIENGTISRFAGTGKKGYTGDGGKATDATFDGPKEIAVGPDGSVYVVDTENEVIRKIDPAGIITTVAGKGRTKTPGLGDGGPALSATLGRPHGVAVGPDGALYIGDTLSHRIRRVR